MIAWMLAAALAAGARAETGRTALTDAAIEQRKAELDQAYQEAAGDAEAEFRDSVAFHTRLKDERLDFERRLLDGRKAMLDSLKGLPSGRRQAVFDGFHVDEARRRQEFREHVAQLKASFRRKFLDERADAKRALKRQREALVEQHQR